MPSAGFHKPCAGSLAPGAGAPLRPGILAAWREIVFGSCLGGLSKCKLAGTVSLVKSVWDAGRQTRGSVPHAAGIRNLYVAAIRPPWIAVRLRRQASSDGRLGFPSV